MYIRSRARWIEEGERITNYFCSLENRNFIRKSITSIEKKDGSIITDKNEIINEKLYYFKENISDIDLHCLLSDQDLNKLSKEHADSLEGLLTYEEFRTLHILLYN